jgi:amidase
LSDSDSFVGLDATAMADLVRRGEASATELVAAAIARIERLNPRLNAVVTAAYDEALAAAAGNLPGGPFAGVPFLLKDLRTACAGLRMTDGSRWLGGYVPDYDNVLVGRYRRAGLLPLGRTNSPEFGLLPTTEPALHGPCRNPWDLGHSTGGSSGGAAAAVAAGIVPMAHATDGGGSIRIPAACCGVFGLKPTRGRITFAPDLGDVMSGLVNHHAVTMSVRDSAALLDAVAGPAPGDPYLAPPPERPYAAEVGADPGRLRIAFATTALDGTQHPDCVAAVEDAARLCADLGHVVEEARPDLDLGAFGDGFITVFCTGLAWTLEGLARRSGLEPSPERVEPLTWALYQRGRAVSGADYLAAVQALQADTRRLARFLGSHDLWLTPTVAAPPPPLGHFDPAPDDPLRGLDRAREFIPFTPLANAAGLPAMSVPLCWNAAGLPIGTHFMARLGEEGLLFRLAAQLEAARPWRARRPPVSATA